MIVGLISDTHSLMRGEALAALAGVELILHAGDVGSFAVLRELQAIAPVHAVAGNTDDPILGLPPQVNLTLEGLRVHVSHGHEAGSPTPDNLVHRYTADVIVYDLDELEITPSWIGEPVYDLPGGEWRRVQHAKGYHHILVNGVETFTDGECTDATPGKLLRHGRG